jgi:hypothetical protein
MWDFSLVAAPVALRRTLKRIISIAGRSRGAVTAGAYDKPHLPGHRTVHTGNATRPPMLTRFDNHRSASARAESGCAGKALLTGDGTVLLTVLICAVACDLSLLALAPAGAILYILPGAWSCFAFGLAVLLTWSVITATMGPLATVLLMQRRFGPIRSRICDSIEHTHLHCMSGEPALKRAQGLGR